MKINTTIRCGAALALAGTLAATLLATPPDALGANERASLNSVPADWTGRAAEDGAMPVSAAARPAPPIGSLDPNDPASTRPAADTGPLEPIAGGYNDPSAYVAATGPAPGTPASTGVGTSDPNDPDSWVNLQPAGSFDCVCAETYEPGDIVTATVASPSGNAQIPLGATGVVVCGRLFGGGEADLVLVQWNIDNGHDGFGACDCPSDGSTPPGTGWYVNCGEIERTEPILGCTCIEEFEPGDVVVTTVDQASSNAQLPLGSTGIVQCGRFFGGGESDLILVRWNIDNGHDGNDACDCPSTGSTPEGTGWYVRCNEVTKLIQAPEPVCVCGDYQTGDRIVAVVDAPDGNASISIGSTGTVICGRFVGSGLGNDNALLIAWDDITNGHDGFNACDCGEDGLPAGANFGWYVLCDDVAPADGNCICLEDYAPGDEVIALADNTQGNAQISAGTVGTVRCGRFFTGGGEANLVLVDWPIDNGHDGFDACDCPADGGFGPGVNTGWYVACDTIARVDDADCVCIQEYRVGDRVFATVDNPDGNGQIFAGSPGTVVCGRKFLGGEDDLVLVKWDGVTTGHNGSGACDCGADGLPAGSTDGWYVRCTELARAGCSDADVDDDGVVGFSDLLSILSNFGDCFGCPEDVDGDDVAGFSDVLSALAAWGPCP